MGIVAGLFGTIACLDDLGPNRFTTKDACNAGETEGCQCPSGGHGRRSCGADGFFGECRCLGCTAYPDCKACGGDCRESCVCLSTDANRVRARAECSALCDADGGKSDGASTEDGDAASVNPS